MEIGMIIGAGMVVMIASLAGVFFIGRTAELWLESRLSYLVAFSAGVFLVTSGALALEVFHIFEDSILLGVLFIAAGYLGAWAVEYFMPESHHHHDPHDHDHQHGRTSARKIIVGDAIHNVGDGIMLVPAFLISPALGLAVTVSVLIHETLQEISEFFVLKQAGYATKRALFINFTVASTIFIGIGLSYVAVSTLALEGTLLALSAGFFLHVVFHDLLPKRHDHASTNAFVQHILVLLIGLGVMFAVSVALSGGHVHGEDGHEEHVDEAHGPALVLDHEHDHAGEEYSH